MKSFNKVITIEVQVDAIAQQLLEVISADFKHRELLAESIVGRMLYDNSLSFLYNSLSGFNSSVNFKVGDIVAPTDSYRIYGYWTPESIEKKDSVWGDITSAEIITIDEYADKKLCIQFNVPNRKGEMEQRTEWVNHTNWNRISTDIVIPENAYAMEA